MTWKFGDPAPGWAERTLTPDCGHTVTVSGMAAGYATDRETDRTLCYACADASERERMAALPVGGHQLAYVSTDGRTLTTWTGGTLARVTGHSVARTGFHRSEVWRFWAVAPDGSRWFGANAGHGMAINVRRVKS